MTGLVQASGVQLHRFLHVHSAGQMWIRAANSGATAGWAGVEATVGKCACWWVWWRRPERPSPIGITTTTAAAPTAVASAEQLAKALAAAPAALTSVATAKRQAACSSYTSGQDAFQSAFKMRFDAQFTPITSDELSTVRGSLDQVCGG